MAGDDTGTAGRRRSRHAQGRRAVRDHRREREGRGHRRRRRRGFSRSRYPRLEGLPGSRRQRDPLQRGNAQTVLRGNMDQERPRARLLQGGHRREAKKLVEAGRLWATESLQAAPAGEGENEFEAACARMGIPDEALEAAQDDGDDDDDGDGEADRYGLWAENGRAFHAFLAVCRLWRYHPVGGVLGLDRPGVESELRMRKIKVNAALLDDLAAIEQGVLEVWNTKK
ncbi:MAG: hypothetical protein EPO36_14330 [Chloroflexota bacterium]|nr:MAG: hypothetical protein EPO36_14330 [Chloroflexota bacterium]